MIKMRCTGGRYPFTALPVHKKHLITACLTVREGVVTLQVNDQRYPDRWEHFEIPAEELRRLLGRDDG